MVWLHLRKSVMGNGRCSGESLGRTLEKDSGKNLLWVRALGGLVVLLVAGSVLLGLGSRRNTQKSVAQGPASPIPMLSRLSLKSKPEARAILGQLPLVFKPNQGQADPRAKFLARGTGYSMFLDANTAVLAMQTAPPSSSSAAAQPRQQFVRMKLVGSNPAAALAGADPLPGKSNYMIGNDPQKWHTGIPQFGGVHYASVYPGIDLVFYGNQGHLEYDFRVAPGSNPAQAELEFDGAKRLELQDGALLIASESNSVRLEAPRVYQEIAGRRQPVEASFALRGGNRVGFALGLYDRSHELVIDPVLSFSTYFGGSGDEFNTYVAVQGGTIFVTGSTNSLNLPTSAGVFQPAINPAANARNVYVVSITPPLGSNPAFLNYVTYLGGSGSDIPVGIGVDGGDNPYVAGTTTSTNFPTSPNAYQTAPQTTSPGVQQICFIPTETCHVFVTLLNNSATAPLKYSSYLSGNGNDVASGMAIDATGDIFVTGTTSSNNPGNASQGIQFPASTIPQGQAFQPIPATGGSTQFFVTKVNTNAPTTGSIAYSTYFGGGTFVPPLVATGGGITVDSNGNIYFSGTTNLTYTGTSSTTDFPILN